MKGKILSGEAEDNELNFEAKEQMYQIGEKRKHPYAEGKNIP